MHPNDYHEAQPRAAELCLPSGTYSGWDRAADKVRHLWLSLFRGRPEDSYEIRALLRMAGGELGTPA